MKVVITVRGLIVRHEERLFIPCALIEHLDMKVYWRSGGAVPRIIGLSTTWR
jgi:hypothetical protein